MKSGIFKKDYHLDGGKVDRDRKIHFFDWGVPESKEVIVCVHGLTRNATDFNFLARAIQGRYRLICIDVIGRGESDHLSGEDFVEKFYNNSQYATDITELLQHLGLSSVNWLGTSMGGLIGMSLAANGSGLIKNLILNDVNPFISLDSLVAVGNSLTRRREFDTLVAAEQEMRERYAHFGGLNDDQWNEVTCNSIKSRDDGRYEFTYDPRVASALKAFDVDLNRVCPARKEKLQSVRDAIVSALTGLWSQLEVPVLALYGAASEILPTPSELKVDIGGKKNCTVVKFTEKPPVGHAPIFHNAHQVRTVTDWLDAHTR